MEPFHADWFGQYKYDSLCMQSLLKFDLKFQIIAQLFDSIRNENTLFAQH